MLKGITIVLALGALLLAALGRTKRFARLRYPGWACFAGCLFCMLLSALPWTHMLLFTLLLLSVSAWRMPREL